MFYFQYGCYLEECSHKSRNPSQRRDHCIKNHNFPHDFHFEIRGYTNKIKKGKQSSSSSYSMDCDDKRDVDRFKSSVVQTAKLVAENYLDEDVELENKSILLTAQRKPITNFSFGHAKCKVFRNNDKSYAKALVGQLKDSKNKHQTSALDDNKMIDDLMNSLP